MTESSEILNFHTFSHIQISASQTYSNFIQNLKRSQRLGLSHLNSTVSQHSYFLHRRSSNIGNFSAVANHTYQNWDFCTPLPPKKSLKTWCPWPFISFRQNILLLHLQNYVVLVMHTATHTATHRHTLLNDR